jgi:hypothetical protein
MASRKAKISSVDPTSGVKEVLDRAPKATETIAAVIENPIVQILMSAAATFQTVETSRLWLLTPSVSLGNVAPVSLIATPEGRRTVANELGLIEHGMF